MGKRKFQEGSVKCSSRTNNKLAPFGRDVNYTHSNSRGHRTNAIMANPFEQNTTSTVIATITTTPLTALSNASQDTSSSSSSSSMISTANTIGYTTMDNQTNATNASLGNDMMMSEDDQQMLYVAYLISDFVNKYYVPIICCTGSIGNILSVFVFFMTKLRKLSSSFYLAALAISDTCFLCGLFVQWLNFLNVNIYNLNYFCQFFTFISYLASFCSVWFVVAFTVERFIAVMYPLKRQIMCTVRRAKIVLLGLTLAGCVHCVPYILIAKPVYSAKLNDTICDLNTTYKVRKSRLVNKPTIDTSCGRI